VTRERRFQDVLDECVASVAERRLTVEECLRLYPQWAERLEPLLRLAAELPRAYTAQPRDAYQAESRRRFLAAVHGPRQPAAVSKRPLLAIPWPPRLPQRLPRPVLAALAAAVLAVVVFPSFLLVTSGDSLPGDWRYPIKRTGERVRFAFVFGEDSRRSFRIGLAEERLEELEALAAGGRSIKESAIRELARHTEPLVEDLDPQDPVAVPQDHVERIEVLMAKEQEILDQVEPLIEENAADDLQQAKEVSSEGQVRALTILSLAASQEPQATREGTATAGPMASPAATAEGTPGATVMARGTATVASAAEGSPTGTAATPAGPTPESTPIPHATGTPAAEEPAATPEATAEATPPAVIRRVVPLPEDSTGGLGWSLVTIGDFSARVPNHLENGWVVSNHRLGQPGERLFIGHRLGLTFDVVVTIKVESGEASVYALIEGASQRIKVEDVATTVPSAAEIVFHILESINIGSS
jgi:hypothetical protein